MKARFCPVLEDPPCSRCSLLFYQPPSPLALFLPPAVSRLCFSSFFLSIQPFNFCLSLSLTLPIMFVFPFYFSGGFPLISPNPRAPSAPVFSLSSDHFLSGTFADELIHPSLSSSCSLLLFLCFEGAQGANPAGLFVLNGTDSNIYKYIYVSVVFRKLHCQHSLW